MISPARRNSKYPGKGRAAGWHSVGALGLIELTAPGRSAHVASALRRIGLTNAERRYLDLHAARPRSSKARCFDRYREHLW